ncbi:reverse transcriptase domain-containing protein [Tanacetum coccineum]
MPPKRTSTSEAPTMTQAAIKKLVADSVSAALEAQAANMANTDNTTRPREAHIAKKNISYKIPMTCQPINFKGTKGAIGLIRWFERTESVFSYSNCTEDCKVKFATGTLTEESLSWWNSFAQPIGIEEAYKITWVEFKKLLIKKYCPRSEVQKMEDEFYHLIVKGNDLKAYVRRFRELATLYPTMVPDSEKMMEVFIGGLPRSIEGNVTASKPQTLEEAINIAQRLMDQLEKTENSSMKAEDDLLALSLSLKQLESLKACMKSLALDLDLEGRFQSHNVRNPEKDRSLHVKMDDPNITVDEYIRLEEEKARWRGKVFNWETAKYVFNETLMFELTVSSLNNEIDFRISIDESDDEDYTVIFDKNSFSYEIISVNDLKTDSENDNEKVKMPLFPSPEPTVSYFDDLEFFKDFENEFPAIVYNDALMSKSDLLTEPILNSQHIDEFNLKDETSLSECDEEEQNILYFNDLFSFNVIYPDDSKSDEDNDDDKIDIVHSSRDLSVKPLPDVINNDDGAYAHGSNKLLETTIYREWWRAVPERYACGVMKSVRDSLLSDKQLLI